MSEQEIHRGPANYQIGDDGRQHLESTRAVFFTAKPHPSERRDQWTGARLRSDPAPEIPSAQTTPERRTIPDSVSAQMRRTRMFSRTASLEDLIELAVVDPQVGELAQELVTDHLIELSVTPVTAALEYWRAMNPDLVAKPAVEIDLSVVTERAIQEVASQERHVNARADLAAALDREVERRSTQLVGELTPGRNYVIHTPIT